MGSILTVRPPPYGSEPMGEGAEGITETKVITKNEALSPAAHLRLLVASGTGTWGTRSRKPYYG